MGLFEVYSLFLQKSYHLQEVTVDRLIWENYFLQKQDILAGIKFFMNEPTSLFVEYQYQLFGGDVGDEIDNITAIMAGISWKF